MTSKKPTNADKLNHVLENIGNVILSNVCIPDLDLNTKIDKVDNGTKIDPETTEVLINPVKKYVLNTKVLIKTLIQSVTELGDVTSLKIDPKDAGKISSFLDSTAHAVDTFCDFLDYDRDGVVELIAKDQEGKISEGQDVEALLNDVSPITSAFRNKGDLSITTIGVLSSLAIYFTSDSFSHSKDDFIVFKSACEDAYRAYAQILSIDHKKFFEENSSDMMKFIINLCVVIVPIFDLLGKKIAALNSGAIQSDMVITSEDIKKAFTEMYGTNVEFILNLVDRLTNIFLKTLTATSTGKKILNLFKCRCCTCCNVD
jgi:hypothetical protein